MKKILLSFFSFCLSCILGVQIAKMMLPVPQEFVKQEFVNNKNSKQQVLAAENQKVLGKVSFNIPAVFNDTADLKKGLTVDGKSTFNDDVSIPNHNLDLGTGNITAGNVLYGVKAGTGLKSTGGQNPTISLDTTGNVTSVQGQTGAVTLTAGSGISVS